MILAALALTAAMPLFTAETCTPHSTHGAHVTVDERVARVTLDRFLSTYFSEDFNNALAPHMGIKSRELVNEKRLPDGDRVRRVRMRPEMTLQGPLRMFGSDDQLIYDEVSSYDAQTQTIRFYIDNAACDQLRYGGSIHFVPDGDGVRMHIDALLQVDAPLVGGIVEALVQGGVKDGYKKFGRFMQDYVDRAPPEGGVKVSALLVR